MAFRVSPLASVVLLGWVLAASQTVLLRETLAAAQGNELAIALVLGQWLVLTAAGSALAGWLPSRRSRGFFVAGGLALGPALFLALLTARGLPRIFALVPGELLSLDQHLLGSFYTLLPVCLVGGASFTLSTRLPGVLATTAYLAEAAGWLAGGVTATWLVESWHPFAIAAALSAGALLAATLLLRWRWWTLAAVGLAMAAALGHRGVAAIETVSLSWRWPGQTIQASAYTRHGHVAVLAQGDQRSLFVDGHLALVLPERQSSEELVHLALAQLLEPGRIFVAQGLGGLLPEILKHPVDEVILAEPDTSMAKMEMAAADPAAHQALADRRVHMLVGDLRNLLRRTGAFDAVLLSPAEPSTLLAARLLTRECFAEVRRALRPGGVLAFALPGAENYTSPELVARNGSVWKALTSTFAHVAVTPLSTNYFLASDGPLTRDPIELARRLDERKVSANFVDRYALAALMPEERVQEVVRRYQGATGAASSDRWPTAYLHGLLVSGQADAGGVARLLRWALGLHFGTLALGLAAFLLLPALLISRRRRGQGCALLVVSAVGFAGMASTVLLLVVTQAAMGALHHLLGALLAANMAGLALAAWAPRPRWQLRGALGFGMVVPALIPLLSRVSTHAPASVVLAALLLAALAAGAAVGIAFRAALLVGTSPATTYAMDLLGAALAAPIIAAVVLPGFGLDAACGFVEILFVPAATALVGSRTTSLPR
jgi:spermidine synthase